MPSQGPSSPAAQEPYLDGTATAARELRDLFIEMLDEHAPSWGCDTDQKHSTEDVAEALAVEALDWMQHPGRPVTSAATLREQLARMVEDYPGPDPSPADPAWWAGYTEARRDLARVVRDTPLYDPDGEHE